MHEMLGHGQHWHFAELEGSYRQPQDYELYSQILVENMDSNWQGKYYLMCFFSCEICPRGETPRRFLYSKKGTINLPGTPII